MQSAHRLNNLPPYLFADLDKMVQKEQAKGKEIIKLGIGDPGMKPPEGIIKAATQEMYKGENHGYPAYDGIDKLKHAIKEYYQSRFGVELNPDREILTLIGSKEGIANISQAILNPGDINFIPDPSYPVYKNGTILAGGTPHSMPLKQDNGFIPELESIPQSRLSKGKIVFMNYPNNPTSAVASKDFYSHAVKFCQKNKLLLCNDAAYSEIAFDDYQPQSLLSVPGAKEVAIEFNSLSKTFNMTGWRVGFVVGNEKAISALAKYKTNVDSGVFTPLQLAATHALENRHEYIPDILKAYKERRDLVIEFLEEAGFHVYHPKATFYVWAQVPGNQDSFNFTKSLLTKTGVVVTPGIGFGKHGEGYFRIALTVTKDRLKTAMEKICEYFS
ncbi:LL-diaminopimelate aminotransferase [Natranaerobius thermophilus]|uniref:LL-diaminopimelate aminotransferase n=1 Tax=Natranaerobius thermophilus (strain ATCC BAA-1301 / DSM 18059 / JW/NM-WN-LF) TaxID=457570 RepID=DAPAT_NATTJ|nr:LL-diaminopimelate aminotransferase [Natranaerobius thermophilus]B2A250.1 RecName: Full=LL-diaminopimelate aminotransferase; Short=DAP-AT; Short=DAP-aminotransferase; Short=LL-DAP-aminotransferase [Natranaerobius thermophilus JW/NM-WN-LF]ACB84855.1 aminotransferase class I and II [Natranaerobius thermophilus JW/NM-WN-LF]